jgi:sulfatase modifying factor 1
MSRPTLFLWLAAISVCSACGGSTVEEQGQLAAQPPSAIAGSCREGVPGADRTCGVNRDTDCCATEALPGGTFNRRNDPTYPATVSPFKLDRFEVTIGRFRRFVAAYPGSRPAVGAGENPHAPGTGWQAQWDLYLPPDVSLLRSKLTCKDSLFQDPAKVLWTDEPGENEHAPIGCVSWAIAFAFCAWDGGRLPIEVEWEFALVGGDEQRPFPWGSEKPDATRAVLMFTPDGFRKPVGSVPLGAARWGHLDMNGSRYEFVFDATRERDDEYPLPCENCVTFSSQPKRYGRYARDSTFYQTDLSAVVHVTSVSNEGSIEIPQGIRCARD